MSVATRTHTRTHTVIEFANPYLRCDNCKAWVTGWHNDDRCGCDDTFWNEPCGCERVSVTSACPSWGPVDSCDCARALGSVDHPAPPGLLKE